MNSILNDYKLANTKEILYILPIIRLKIKSKIRINNITLYPAGYIKINELLENQINLDETEKYKKENIDIFNKNTLIAFTHHSFSEYPASITSNEEIIKGAETQLSFIINYIKFKYCHITNPASSLGRVGQIKSGENILLMFSGIGSPFTRIIRHTAFINTITVGSGLKPNEENPLANFPLLNSDIAEVGFFSKHALEIYSNTLEENTDTGKFIQIIRLFEFIANPIEYEKFQNAKKKIISHIAKNIHEIHKLSEEFKYYSSGEQNNGLRTQIIHNGKNLEELIEDKQNRHDLFVKLQSYLHFCLNDLLINHNHTWHDIETLRINKREKAKKDKIKTTYKDFAETLIVIDANSLNNSLIRNQKVFDSLYPNKKLHKINLLSLLMLILKNTRRLIMNKIYSIFIFYSGIEKLAFTSEYFDEFDEKSASMQNIEFNFYTFNIESEDRLIEVINSFVYNFSYDEEIKPDCSNTNNLIFCGDRQEYDFSLSNLIENSNKSLTIIKDCYHSNMKTKCPYFSIGHLTGLALGLSSDEL